MEAQATILVKVAPTMNGPAEVQMDQRIDDLLMSLAEFRALTHLSPSGERKHRKTQADWAPHLQIGRKVFYRRAGVLDWLERREVNQVRTR